MSSVRKNASNFSLSSKARLYLKWASLAYALAICVMCFSPQQQISNVRTPGIFYLGRVPFLLTPFNTLLRLAEIDTWSSLVWIAGQNLVNIFLLYPLVLGLCLLYPSQATYSRAWRLGLGLSLFIETGQIVLDLLFDFNRVFELDDLWTNTLGAVLAYLTFQVWLNYVTKNKKN